MRSVNGTEALARVRSMRRTPTDAERLLWARLRDRRLVGVKFRRQVWIGSYIADFASLETRLVIELDGSQHGETQDYDARRDVYLEAAGYRTLRFWNNDVMTNMAGVLEAIGAACSLPSPSHRPAGGGPLPLPVGEGI